MVLAVAQYPDGVGRMENKRFQFGDRRENNAIHNFPFKDSNGVTVKKCRRKMLLHLVTIEILPSSMYNKDVIHFF